MQTNRSRENALASADEVNDLQMIAIVEGCFRPLRAGDDLAIEFDRDSISFHAKLLDELGEGDGFVEGLVFAVDSQAHKDSFRFRVPSFKRSALQMLEDQGFASRP